MKIFQWCRYTKHVAGRLIADSYFPITETNSDLLGYSDDSMKGEAFSWAENLNDGHKKFDYNYEWLDNPPREWVTNKIKDLKHKIDSSNDYLKALSGETHSDAVDFMLWTMEGDCHYSINDEDSWQNNFDRYEFITTSELYEKYLESRKK